MNKRQHIYLSIGLCCCFLSLGAQNLERQLISTSGASVAPSFQVDYTIGEPINFTHQGTFHATQGFQQGAYQDAVLAIADLTLQGERINNEQVKLTWTMSQMEDNIVVIIERRLAMQNQFVPIGKISHVQSGQFTHIDNNTSHDLTYYRLKKMDNHIYSNTVSVEGLPFHHVFQLSPNPVDDVIQLRVNLNEQQHIEAPTFYLTDATGRNIMKKSLSLGATSYLIDGFADLPSGVYFAFLKNGKKVWQQWQLIK